MSLVHSIVVFIMSLILDGIAVMLLWRWFVAPTFGLPVLGWSNAAGLVLLVSLLTHPRSKKESKKEQWETDVISIMVPLLAIIVGWIVVAALGV